MAPEFVVMGETNLQMWQRLGLVGKQGLTRRKPDRNPTETRQRNKPKTDYPGKLLFDIQALGWPEPVREHQFHPIRNWRLDLAWPDIKLAVECHGGIYTQGRHVRGKGFTNDREKMNEAMMLGWKVIEVACPHQMGQALQWIECELKERGLI